MKRINTIILFFLIFALASCDKSHDEYKLIRNPEGNLRGVLKGKDTVLPPIYKFETEIKFFHLLFGEKYFKLIIPDKGILIDDDFIGHRTIAFVDSLEFYINKNNVLFAFDSLGNTRFSLPDCDVDASDCLSIKFFIFPAKTKDIKYGLIDLKGNIILNCEYDYIERFSNESYFSNYVIRHKSRVCSLFFPVPKIRFVYHNDMLVASKNGKFSLFDKNGRTIFLDRYDWIYDYSDDLILVRLNGKYGFIDSLGKEIIGLKYDSIGNFDETVFDNTLAYLYNSSESQSLHTSFIPFVYEYFESKGLSEGLIRVKKDGKWGYIDTMGREVIPLKYSSAKNFNRGVAEVELKGKKLLIDRAGNVVKKSK